MILYKLKYYDSLNQNKIVVINLRTKAKKSVSLQNITNA